MLNHTTNEIPYGYCKCGCGQKAKIADYSSPKNGWIKGEPRDYIRGHWNRRYLTEVGPNPSGLCMCGCGQKTKIAYHTDPVKGWVQGQPLKFILGHQGVFSLEKLFWDRVDKRSEDECWDWIGTIDPTGYGRINHADKPQGAHRASYKIHYGPIPDGMDVCHKCDRRKCVNPTHLFLGTPAENTADMVAKGRNVKGERQPTSKIKTQDVIYIRALYASGMRISVISRKVGMSKTQTGRIVKREAWAHIP